MHKTESLSSPERRVQFIEATARYLPTVGAEPFDVLVVDFARQLGACAIVKGLRATSDFEYELEMNQLNRKMAPEIESIYMFSSPQFSFLSSSGVKEIAMFGGDLADLVPPRVAARLQEELGR